MGVQLRRSLAMSQQPTPPSGTRSYRGLGQACADHPLRRFLLSGEPPGRPFWERIKLVIIPYYHEFNFPLIERSQPVLHPLDMTSRSLWARWRPGPGGGIFQSRTLEVAWHRAGGRSRLRGAGELFPPVEGIAEEAHSYGYTVDDDPECDLALGHVLEGKGFLVHDCCPWPDCEELSVLVELQGQKVPVADIG